MNRTCYLPKPNTLDSLCLYHLFMVRERRSTCNLLIKWSLSEYYFWSLRVAKRRLAIIAPIEKTSSAPVQYYNMAILDICWAAYNFKSHSFCFCCSPVHRPFLVPQRITCWPKLWPHPSLIFDVLIKTMKIRSRREQSSLSHSILCHRVPTEVPKDCLITPGFCSLWY